MIASSSSILPHHQQQASSATPSSSAKFNQQLSTSPRATRLFSYTPSSSSSYIPNSHQNRTGLVPNRLYPDSATRVTGEYPNIFNTTAASPNTDGSRVQPNDVIKAFQTLQARIASLETDCQLIRETNRQYRGELATISTQCESLSHENSLRAVEREEIERLPLEQIEDECAMLLQQIASLESREHIIRQSLLPRQQARDRLVEETRVTDRRIDELNHQLSLKQEELDAITDRMSTLEQQQQTKSRQAATSLQKLSNQLSSITVEITHNRRRIFDLMKEESTKYTHVQVLENSNQQLLDAISEQQQRQRDIENRQRQQIEQRLKRSTKLTATNPISHEEINTPNTNTITNTNINNKHIDNPIPANVASDKLQHSPQKPIAPTFTTQPVLSAQKSNKKKTMKKSIKSVHTPPEEQHIVKRHVHLKEKEQFERITNVWERLYAQRTAQRM